MDQFPGVHHHLHRDEDDEDEEEEGSEEMVMMNSNNNMGTNPNNHIHNSPSSSSLNRVKMVEALSQVQIQPTTAITTTISSTPPNSSRPRYRECMRNHAINVMGHALDGCGEFMPGGPEGSFEALKCAACNCHRNFHRKEEVGEHHTSVVYSHSSQTHSHLPRTASHSPFGSYYRTTGNTSTAPSGYLHLGPPPHPRPLALPSPSGGGGVSHSRGEEDDVSNQDGHNGGMVVGMSGTMMRNGKKRFRTKFAADQKERMLAMAERIGWRIQKCDEELVQQFCNETGVKRQVFKVWMHNNKHTLGKISSNMNNNGSSSNNSGGQMEQQQQQLM